MGTNKLLLLLIFIFLYSNLNAINIKLKQEGPEGCLVQERFYSDVLGEYMDYAVYYPYGYDTSTNYYDVMYLLHGLWDNYMSIPNEGSVEVLLNTAISNNIIKPTVVIFPNAYNTWYSDIKDGRQMRTAFMKDLFPYVETNFRVKNNREARTIGGYSMGGSGALIFSFSMPEYFSKAIVMGPAITPLGKSPQPAIRDIVLNLSDEGKAFREYFYEDNTNEYGFSQSKWDYYSYHTPYNNYIKNKKDYKVSFFVTVGTLDAVTPPKDIRTLVDSFSEEGIDYYYIESKGGDHAWNFWSLSLARALYYFGNKDKRYEKSNKNIIK